MLLADTSAWVEFLVASDSGVDERMRKALTDGAVVVIDPVLMEVLAGTRSMHVEPIRRLLDAQHHEPLLTGTDWIDAATIYRGLRGRGVTVRSQIDALIAAVAIRLDVPVLHRDRDYDAIATHTRLATVSVG